MYLPVSLSLERVPTFSCLTGRYFKNNKLVSFTYGISAFQTDGFVLSPRASVPVCEPLVSSILWSLEFHVFLEHCPPGFQRWEFRVLISPLKDPGVGDPNMEYKPLAPQRKFLYFEISWLSFWGWNVCFFA